MIKKTFWVLLPFFLVIIILTGWLIFKTPFGAAFIISGDSVYVDNVDALINVTPHTITHSQPVIFEFTPKQFSGDIDAVWGFDTDLLQPSNAQYYKPYNVSTNTTKIFYNVSSFEDGEGECDFGNEYNTFKKEGTYLLYNQTGNEEYVETTKIVCYNYFNNLGNNDYEVIWNTITIEDWKKFSVSKKIEHEFMGMDTWYVVKDKSVTAGQTYKVKVSINVKTEPLYAKYFFALKPSSETIQEAIANDHFYYLDPWANVSGSVASLQFEEGSGVDVADEWGGDNDGQMIGTWTWVIDYPSYNLTGDGSPYSVNSSVAASDYIQIKKAQSNMTLNDDSFSIAFWFKLVDPTTEQRFVFGQKGDLSSDEWLQIIYRTSPSRLSAEIRDSGGSSHTAGGNFSDTTDWHSLVMIYNSTEGQILGWMDNKQNMTGVSADLWADRHPNLSIGSKVAASSTTGTMIDNFQVYDRVLNNSEVLHFFNHGNVTGEFAPVSEAGDATTTINTPTQKYYFSSNLTLNFTIIGGDTVYTCNRSVDGFFENTYSNVNNDTNIISSFVNYTVGVHNLTIKCSGTISNLTANVSVAVHIGDVIWADRQQQATSYETRKNNFTINLTYNPDVVSIGNMAISLMRGSTNYNGTKAASGTGNITSNFTLQIPLADTNNSVVANVWNVTYTLNNGTIHYNNSASNNQNIYYVAVITNVSVDKNTVTTGDLILVNATATKIDNLTYLTSRVDFQNINKSMDFLTNKTTEIRFSRTRSVLSTGAANTTTVTAFAWLNVSFGGITKERISIVNASVSIYTIQIDDCSVFTTLAINLTNRDADTQNIIPNNIKATFNIWKDNKSISNTTSLSFENINTTGICIYPAWASYVTDAIIEYGNYTYVIRNYYLNNATLDNVTDIINLYHLLDTRDTIFDILVQDQSLNPLSNAYIKAQRFYTENNTYLTTSMAKTDAQGKTVMKLVADEVDYKFIIEQNLLIVYISDSQKVQSCTYPPCELTFYVKDDIDVFDSVDTPSGVSYNLYFNNQSNIFYFTFSDTSGLTQTGSLNVTQRRMGREDEVLCSTSVSASSATLSCNISGYEGIFIAQASIERSWRTLETLWVEIIEAGKILRTKVDSMVLGTMMVMTFGAIGLFNPAVALILVVFAIILTTMFGIVSLLYPAIISLIIIVIIFILNLKT